MAIQAQQSEQTHRPQIPFSVVSGSPKADDAAHWQEISRQIDDPVVAASVLSVMAEQGVLKARFPGLYVRAGIVVRQQEIAAFQQAEALKAARRQKWKAIGVGVGRVFRAITRACGAFISTGKSELLKPSAE